MPGLETNLFSIVVATEIGLEARFRGNEVLFYHKDSLILKGRRTGDTLFLLDLKPQTITTESNTPNHTDTALSANLRTSLTIWHQRL